MSAEAGTDTWVRVESKADSRDRYVGILADVLNKVKAESNELKREMVGSKDKAEMSREEVYAEERAEKEEEEAALQDMIQAEVEYWESQKMAMIEEYAREKVEA